MPSLCVAVETCITTKVSKLSGFLSYARDALVCLECRNLNHIRQSGKGCPTLTYDLDVGLCVIHHILGQTEAYWVQSSSIWQKYAELTDYWEIGTCCQFYGTIIKV